ncbi:D-isomer specific 2-hydroxyacid dehydrogenase, catalytic domain-containing protein [Artemisia annua]|uniref:D-isomer specific 2-hydroxyacid dehydrogenase, catalytic domain-containing protein n=1 Tax=Artemisia annua TaxID=35608 RepID=A0A2U1Q1A7_ARTAN|nr:D-isomer specific 2-hydroxyacid dehydrogenase, catalytic domain-containing protein [Artemisia annua]
MVKHEELFTGGRKGFNQDMYSKKVVKYVGEPASHMDSIASSAVYHGLLKYELAIRFERIQESDKELMEFGLDKENVWVTYESGLLEWEALALRLQRGLAPSAPDVPEELFHLDNVVMTPSHAMVTKESMRDLYDAVVRNLDAFFSNKPLTFEVV